MDSERPLIAIIGPTAVGKTELVLRIAHELAAEIISVDSMQVYRGMDIGTAKPTRAEQQMVRHHLIDLVDPGQEYNVASFIKDANRVSAEIRARGKMVLLSGGTGLYLDGFQRGVFRSGKDDRDLEIRAGLERDLREQGRAALFRRLQETDPRSADRIHPNDTNRLLRALEIHQTTGITWSDHLEKQRRCRESGETGKRNILKIGLTRERGSLYERINRRAGLMLENGLIEEVESLLRRGYSPKIKAMQAIGYRHVVNLLEGRWRRAETEELLARDTRHYAKRQLTWFRKDPEIHWVSPDSQREIVKKIRWFMDSAK